MPSFESNPYEMLNVATSASSSQIKAAYRKLALKFHPDKQSTPDEKNRCSEIFTNIANAYDILRDEGKRAEFDRFGVVREGVAEGDASNYASSQSSDPFASSSFGGDPFASSFFRQSNRRMGEQDGGFFTDPFALFDQVFGDGFHSESIHHSHHHQSNNDRSSGLNGFGMMGNMSHDLNGMMNSMMNSAHGQSQQCFSSSSSSSYNSGFGGSRESISTTTRIINGKRCTVTERTLVRPDGTVERHTEQTDDQGFQNLENSKTNDSTLQHGYFRDQNNPQY